MVPHCLGRQADSHRQRATCTPAFKLQQEWREASVLYGLDGSTLSTTSTYGAQSDDISEGRYPDGAARHVSMPHSHGRGRTTVVPNTAPALAALQRQGHYPGQTLSFTANGSDTDLPAQTLTYSLGTRGRPLGLPSEPTAAYFTWTPSSSPSTNLNHRSGNG